MEINKKHNNSQSGFALLMTLIVVGVILSIGLSVLELSIKQIKLATNARDSEIAFHAANAGMECSRYWRRTNALQMETGVAIDPTCFGVTASPPTVLGGPVPGITGNGEAFQYDYEFTWGTGLNTRCTEITTLVASSTLPGAGLTINNMTTIIPGYPSGNSKFCEAGTRCTVISVRGYNRPCSGTSNYGTVQREVLLQF